MFQTNLGQILLTCPGANRHLLRRIRVVLGMREQQADFLEQRATRVSSILERQETAEQPVNTQESRLDAGTGARSSVAEDPRTWE